uniref:Uncharacterized protein n=1 Tax=Lotharella globosa TaxID=91324 RepID=A0A7S4DKP4_9EUKA|mmetsp:Transcript_30615/g.59004  ORF Transcript_30615/g.59004 Transcript_30615/m.59004 type:complete len:101 (+) Transcript_30615:1710-2012(+)
MGLHYLPERTNRKTQGEILSLTRKILEWENLANSLQHPLCLTEEVLLLARQIEKHQTERAMLLRCPAERREHRQSQPHPCRLEEEMRNGMSKAKAKSTEL